MLKSFANDAFKAGSAAASLKKILSVVACSAAFIGCSDTQNLISQIDHTLDQEQLAYARVLETAPMRGSGVIEALSVWAKEFEELNGEALLLVSRFGKNPSQKKQIASELSQFHARLDRIFRRSSSIQLPLVPNWEMKAAQQAVIRLQLAYADLHENHAKIFGVPAVGEGILLIGLRPDVELYDTFDDCSKLFQELSVALIVARGDHSCESAHLSACGHQMDLRCVAAKLSLSAMRSCVQEQMSSSRRNKNSGVTPTPVSAPAPAAWLSELDQCKSSEPVLRSGLLLH